MFKENPLISLINQVSEENLRERVKVLNGKRKMPYSEQEIGAVASLAKEIYIPGYLKNGVFSLDLENVNSPEVQKYGNILGLIDSRRRPAISSSAQALAKKVIEEGRKSEKKRIQQELSERAIAGDSEATDFKRGAFLRISGRGTRNNKPS